jgi:dUTP pyrophosphatase
MCNIQLISLWLVVFAISFAVGFIFQKTKENEKSLHNLLVKTYQIPKIGKFYKVSLGQFRKAMKEEFDTRFSDEQIEEMYQKIKLPKRGTTGSAGYDFFAPFDFELYPNDVIKIPTGIRVYVDAGWFLGCVPRSGLGFKYGIALSNTFGVIDEDFFHTKDEGHIYAKLVNRSTEGKHAEIKQGDGFMQGIFLKYGITDNDDSEGVRNGGFGSTDKK